MCYSQRNAGKGLSYAPSLFGTVAQRVLSTPELLDNIFSFLGEGDHVRNALVCKSWSEVAFDILWRDVDDLPRMLHLLAPTEIEPLLLGDRKSTRLNSSHSGESRMPSSA